MSNPIKESAIYSFSLSILASIAVGLLGIGILYARLDGKAQAAYSTAAEAKVSNEKVSTELQKIDRRLSRMEGALGIKEKLAGEE